MFFLGLWVESCFLIGKSLTKWLTFERLKVALLSWTKTVGCDSELKDFPYSYTLLLNPKPTLVYFFIIRMKSSLIELELNFARVFVIFRDHPWIFTIQGSSYSKLLQVVTHSLSSLCSLLIGVSLICSFWSSPHTVPRTISPHFLEWLHLH